MLYHQVSLTPFCRGDGDAVVVGGLRVDFLGVDNMPVGYIMTVIGDKGIPNRAGW